MAVSQTPYTVKVVNEVNISCMDTRQNMELVDSVNELPSCNIHTNFTVIQLVFPLLKAVLDTFASEKHFLKVKVLHLQANH